MQITPLITPISRGSRRGGIYLAVLGTAMVVAILGLSALTVVRLEQLASETTSDGIKARAYAESGVELAMLQINQNAGWRLLPNGTWETNQPIGEGVYTIQVTDPLDGNLANNPRDPVVIRGTGELRRARHILQAMLVDQGTPASALSSALSGGGGLQVGAASVLRITGARVTASGTLTNNGTIDGDAAALLIVNLGSITGSQTILSLGQTMPAPGTYALYEKMGTAISPGATLQGAVLGPKFTTYGPTNSDGIYVITSAGDVTIRDIRLLGTLVVVAPGCRVRLEGSVHMKNYRPDCPVLIVHGNLDLRTDRMTPLSEAAAGVNFNPPLAPFNGTSDSDQADQYPSEILGLVHATGTLDTQQRPRIVGALVVESAGQITGDAEIVYDPGLTESPPMGYSVAPAMRIREGSWTQVVTP